MAEPTPRCGASVSRQSRAVLHLLLEVEDGHADVGVPVVVAVVGHRIQELEAGQVLRLVVDVGGLHLAADLQAEEAAWPRANPPAPRS